MGLGPKNGSPSLSDGSQISHVEIRSNVLLHTTSGIHFCRNNTRVSPPPPLNHVSGLRDAS